MCIGLLIMFKNIIAHQHLTLTKFDIDLSYLIYLYSDQKLIIVYWIDCD